MNASAVRELAKLQGLREQKARSLAAAAERVRIESDRAAREAGTVLDHALDHYADTRSMPRLCLDRVTLAAQRVNQAMAREGDARELAKWALSEQQDARFSWQEAVNEEQLLSCRSAELRRTENRKLADRRDMAAIERRNAVTKGPTP